MSLENVIVEVKSEGEQQVVGSFNNILRSMNQLQTGVTASITKMIQEFNAMQIAIKPIGDKIRASFSPEMDLDKTKNVQAMEGFKKQFTALQDELKPLGKEVTNSLNEIIQPSLTAEQSVQGILDKQKELADFSKTMKTDLESVGLQRLGSQYNGFFKVMGMGMPEFKKFDDGTDKLNKSMMKGMNSSAKFAMRIRWLTHGFRGFRMELLSVMFFGMGLTGLFMGMLKPAMELAGIFDIISTILSIFFLPVALALLDPLLQLMDWMLSMPESTKMVIGVIFLLAAALGSLLFFLGSIGLGLGGLATAFGTLSSILGGVGGFITSIVGLLIGTLLPIFAVIIMALIGFWLAWQTNFGNIKGWVTLIWEGLKQIFQGIWQVISGITELLVGLFSGDSDKVLDGAKKLINGIINIFYGLVDVVMGIIVTLGISLLRGLLGILATIVDLLGKGFGLLWENIFMPVASFFKKWVIDPIKDGFKEVINWVIDKVNMLIRGFNKVSGKVGLNVPEIPKLAKGGFIQKSGIAYLHAGETVVPANATENNSIVNNYYSNPSITINASAGMNVDELVRKVSAVIVSDLGRLSRG